MYGGSAFGLPWNTDNRVMYYNKNLLKAVGLDGDRAPATWEELER